jgi:hypothetical protein
MKLTSWVVTHVDGYDDEESLQRAVTDFATNAHDAWTKFLALTGAGRERKDWNDRGYVARRVVVSVKFETKK